MNLLLLQQEDFIVSDQVARIYGYRFEHLKKILKVQVADQIRVGVLNQKVGLANIQKVSENHIDLEIEHLNETPPPPLPLTLVLALPRPKMLQRIFQTLATMGVAELILIHTEKVEKSFWQTPALSPENIQRHLVLGLEQARTTHLPKVHMWQKKHELWDRLPALMVDKKSLIAHPGNHPMLASAEENIHTLMAIGPEGGFTEDEYKRFVESGFSSVQLGPRIFRVETAVTAIIAKLF